MGKGKGVRRTGERGAAGWEKRRKTRGRENKGVGVFLFYFFFFIDFYIDTS